MTLSDRDKKILTFMVPLLVIAAYWFLLLAPKREEATTASTALTAEQDRLEAARAAAGAADNAQQGFETSYATVVRLGKAIPSTVDMPSLLVQLESAAAGTGISFNAITAGERTAAALPAPAAGDAGAAEPGAEAGGTPAQTGPGTAAESANEAQQAASADAAAAEGSDLDTTTSTPASDVDGGATGDPAAAGTAPAGLETVPLTLSFDGNFFNLADFFHRVKRFVRVANSNVLVSGRLLTIESVNWTSDPEGFPRITAEVGATIYLSPLSQGVTAGATPEGPATTPAGSTPAEGAPAPAAAPTATATP
jgi:Tfp pilus assembly protein PilO